MLGGREPAAIAAFIAIAINLIVSFGLKLSIEQIALINALVAAGLGLAVRQSVFSPNTVQKVADQAAATGNPTVTLTPP